MDLQPRMKIVDTSVKAQNYNEGQLRPPVGASPLSLHTCVIGIELGVGAVGVEGSDTPGSQGRVEGYSGGVDFCRKHFLEGVLTSPSTPTLPR